jgi:hypothetical protein
MWAIACLLLLSMISDSLAFTQQAGLDRLSGSVVSENGTPIAGVKIFAWQDATTNTEGKFDLTNLPSKDSVIYFQKEGFRPKTLVVQAQTSTVEVVLEDDRKTAWFIPACSAKEVQNSHEGAWLEFHWPKDAKLKRIKDIDYVEYLVRVANDSTKPLQLWYGPFVSSGQHLTEIVIRSASFEERSIHDKLGQIIGYDQHGKTQDGMAWRYAEFSGLSASAIYEGVSTEEAASYDRIIDSACQH